MSRMTEPALNAVKRSSRTWWWVSCGADSPAMLSGLADRPFEIDQPPGDRR